MFNIHSYQEAFQQNQTKYESLYGLRLQELYETN